MHDYKAIIDKLDRTNDAVITVFGDYCLDKYLYTDPENNEISVETGLTAFMVHRKAMSPGGAGNVAKNLCKLGAKVICVGTAGLDGEGYELKRELALLGADTSLMIETDVDERCTSTYTKPMQKDENGVYREMNRFDFRSFSPISETTEEKLIRNLEKAVEKSNAVIVLDQFFQRNLGVITDNVREKTVQVAKANPGVFFFADSRSFADEFREMIVKCNNHEFVSTFLKQDDSLASDTDYIASEGRKISARNNRPLIVTLGEKGMLVITPENCVRVDAFRVTGETDICGAGDSSSAGFVLGLTLGLSMPDAARLAAAVSSITIQQIGTTGFATPQMLKELLNQFI